MKTNNNTSDATLNNQLLRLEKKLDQHFEEIENQLKVIDQKRYNAERDLRIQITSSSFDTQQRLEKALRAEIQVAVRELEENLESKFTTVEDKLAKIEKRLNQRITLVGDLITTNMTQKLEDHEKRILRLEKPENIA
ncbi:MAG: hypothetical protein A2857_05040 [Candidatus Levybacteria bacterium RIFCSPHIGHO2_01_FULL_36_15]|nr:MAG: hypothetical protein A2857_05040 [Candidatus Levybacteria bacterium RIFCSPHIGHO2_01_FULL_36_15]OGH38149.1 MAG: hypothetical protein A2905_05205 [Candidatus Levybacteria bacterium RIFCSPLOWO2_01_FULL_36_10]